MLISKYSNISSPTFVLVYAMTKFPTLISVGNLVIAYTKTNVGDEIFEYLEISNIEMFDYTIDEEIIDATG